MKERTALIFPLLLLGFSSTAFCQLLPFQDDDIISTPSFNTAQISSKGISCITLHSVVKPSDMPISDDRSVSKYFFDNSGKLTESYVAALESASKWDTVHTLYYYNKNNLVVKRTDNGDFFDTWYYNWDEKGNVTKEAHVRETRLNQGDGTFKIATQKIISSDSFSYKQYPQQLQQFSFNEDNRQFKKTISQFDKEGRLTSSNCRYTVGWLYTQVDINYDDKGRISRFVITGNINGEVNHSTIVNYDSLNNVVSEEIWMDGKQKHKVEFMYDSGTGLISNKLDMNLEDSEIDIMKFSYEMR